MATQPVPMPRRPDLDDAREPAPVLIAGAGPVGVMTALLLARHGVASVVLEAGAERDTVGSKAICMQRDVLDVFDRVGCAEPMVAEGATWTTGRTYYREHELFVTRFPEVGRGDHPPWINISQTSTERYLADRVAVEPLVDVRFDHEVTAFHAETDQIRVEAMTPHGPVTLCGTHLVGADGAHSVVRRLLDVDFPGHSFHDKFLICDIRADLPFPGERRFYFDPEWNPGRQVLVHQCPDSTWRIDWQVPADYDLDAERADGSLDARIRRITGDLPYEVVWLSVYRFSERCAARFGSGRVFLAGDAAHLYAPFGARGLNSGIQDAENLAWKLAFVRNGWVSGTAARTLLDSYDTERRAAARENLRVTDATMKFLVPHDEQQWAQRRATLHRAVTDPAARRHIDSGKLAEPYWYLDSPLTTPAAHPSRFPTEPGVPRPLVPGVLCPDGPCAVPERPHVTRLRHLFATGITLLTGRTGRVEEARAVAADAVTTPVAVYALPEIDPSGELATTLHATGDSVHMIRPDGHLAAILPAYHATDLRAALTRLNGQHPATAPAREAARDTPDAVG